MDKLLSLHSKLVEALEKADTVLDMIIQESGPNGLIVSASIAQDYTRESRQISEKLLKRLRKTAASYNPPQS